MYRVSQRICGTFLPALASAFHYTLVRVRVRVRDSVEIESRVIFSIVIPFLFL